jgi:hypothetical protein
VKSEEISEETEIFLSLKSIASASVLVIESLGRNTLSQSITCQLIQSPFHASTYFIIQNQLSGISVKSVVFVSSVIFIPSALIAIPRNSARVIGLLGLNEPSENHFMNHFWLNEIMSLLAKESSIS